MLMATMSCPATTSPRRRRQAMTLWCVVCPLQLVWLIMMCPTTPVAFTMAIGLTPRIGVLTSHVFLAPKITLTSLWTSHAPRLSLLVLSKSHLGTLKLSARPTRLRSVAALSHLW